MNTQSNCPFCIDNDILKGEVIAQTPHAFAVVPTNSPHCYLIIPNQHAESIQDLPDDWWKYLSEVFEKLPISKTNFNLSLNCGPAAGQSVKHLHFWVIERSESDKAAGKGLARLIDEHNQE